MNEELIDLETAIKWAREEIAIEGGDFVYKAAERFECRHFECNYYEEDGTPSCLIGRILDRHGLMTPESATMLEGTSADLLEVMENFTDQAQTFLSALQSSQDAGDSWGAALEGAITEAERY